jgi:membrane protease YdiL (CAAX protease family)
VAAKKKRRAPASTAKREEPAAAAAPERPPPRNGVVEVFFGALGLVVAAIFVLLARPWSGDFATWFLAAEVATAIALIVYGSRRMIDRDAPPTHIDELHPRRFFLETWRRMDEEAREERLARKKAGKEYDWRPVVVLAFGAVFLTLMEYWGGSRTYVALVENLHGDSAEPTFWSELRTSPFARLFEFAWWSGWRVLGYFVLPAITLWSMRLRIREHGLETTGFSDHAWIYAFAYSIVLVCVVVVSYTEEFSTYYPFYKLASRSWFDFVAWELLYAAQFFSLEFFFRGYWLKALKPIMGSHAIFAMVVPYCMIHYGKPMTEALAAIIAGVVLGTLAMKTRSIWSGFLIHCSVAVSMDVAALLQTAHLPDRWWPL